MKKKATIGFVAVGAVLAARPVLRRLGQKAREHCQEMASQFAVSGEAAGTTMGPKMREHCEQMAAKGREEAVNRLAQEPATAG